MDTEKFTRYADSPKAATNESETFGRAARAESLEFTSYDLLLLSFWNNKGIRACVRTKLGIRQWNVPAENPAPKARLSLDQFQSWRRWGRASLQAGVQDLPTL